MASFGVLSGSSSSRHAGASAHSDLGLFKLVDKFFLCVCLCECVNGGVLFASPQSALTLVTDIFALGWGVHLGSLQTQGLWSTQEVTWYINIRE